MLHPPAPTVPEASLAAKSTQANSLLRHSVQLKPAYGAGSAGGVRGFTANPVYSQAGPGAPLHRWAAKMTVNKRVTFYLGISYSKSCVLTGRAGGATAQVGCNDDEVNKRVM